MQIILANPRGFCAGVERAIAIVERTIEKFGAPIYVRHEVVHNRFVCDSLRAKGAVFIDDLSEVPKGRPVIFSAHGVSQIIWADAKARGLQVFDATCPLVTRIHRQVLRLRDEGYEIIMIGHKGHPEVEGTMGQCEGEIKLVEHSADVASLVVNNPQHLAYVTQTTLSVDEARATVAALRARFPAILEPQHDDICFATQNRQDAVKQLVHDVDLVFVVGSPTSSNSNRLREVAEQRGVPAFLIDSPEEIDPASLAHVQSVGVTSGASAPEVLVQSVVARLIAIHPGQVQQLAGLEEDVTFALPKELQT